MSNGDNGERISCSDGKQAVYGKTTALSIDLWSHVASFCWFTEQISLRRTNRTLRRAADNALTQAHALHASVLVLDSQSKPRNSDRIVTSKKRDRSKSHCRRKNVSSFMNDCRLSQVSNVCRNLTLLDLAGLRDLTGWIPPANRSDGTHHSNIQHTRTWLLDILCSARKLQTINLSGCIRFDGRCFEIALDQIERDFSRRSDWSPLRHLYLTCCCRVTKETLRSMAESNYLVALETLHVGGCSQTIDDEALMSVFRHCINLKSVEVSGLDHITSTSWFSVLNPMLPKGLEVLYASGCRLVRTVVGDFEVLPARVIEAFPKDNESLKLMTVDSIKALFNERVTHLSDGSLDPLTLGNNLRVLGCNETARATLTDPGWLGYLSIQSGRLKEVELSGNIGVRTVDIQILARTCGSSLQCCNFRACEITNTALEAIGMFCERLVDLDVSACFHVGDEGIIAVATGVCAKTLRALRMSALTLVSNACLTVVGENLHHLLLLDIRNCPDLSHFSSDVPPLIELDARNDWSSKTFRFPDIPTLRIRNGRRLPQVPYTNNTGAGLKPRRRDCIASLNSQRREARQGVDPMPMWHCRDCDLVPSRNRGMCTTCAVLCHPEHSTYLGGVARFSCDCAYLYCCSTQVGIRCLGLGR